VPTGVLVWLAVEVTVMVEDKEIDTEVVLETVMVED
jgi:hypothetical protein